MKRRSATEIIRMGSMAGLICLLAVSCTSRPLEGLLIVTEIPSDNPEGDFKGINWHEHLPSNFIAVRPGIPGKEELLSKDFHSVRAPEISYDGKKLLFAGRKQREDAWQIWEMDLRNRKVRKVTSYPEDCTDPAYLPANRFVFTRQAGIGNPDGEALYAGNLDGSGMERISFHPHEDRAASVLQDGRLVYITSQLYPEPARAYLMVMRPDGTKALEYYRGPVGSEPASRAWETAEGKVLFIQSAGFDSGGVLMSIDRRRPLHSAKELSKGRGGSFRYVSPLEEGRCIVSYRPPGVKEYALYEFCYQNDSLGTKLFGAPGFHIAEAVLVRERQRPRILPSEVNPRIITGQLFCQDINYPDNQAGNKPAADREVPRAVNILVSGVDGPLGVARVEEDGSFFLKVVANTPFQFSTLDEEGETVNGPSGWIWIRPGERRGCVGCHEDPETVPENRVPLAVKKPPVEIPVHKTMADAKIE